MFKRDGANFITRNNRSANCSIAAETIEICNKKQYCSPNGKTIDISNELNNAVQNTILYSDLPEVTINQTSVTIEVTNETTAEAAERLLKNGKTNVVALNFASAINPGGGFLAGANAQEEDLCRCSGLYQCIKNKPKFYNENIAAGNRLYLDNIIYSPNVPFFRDSNNKLLDYTFPLSIITSPAPNLIGAVEIDESVLESTILKRAEKILKVAHLNGHKNIVLGAWGCGAFCNDPVMVADAFKTALLTVPAFEHVCFAVWDTRTPPHIYNTFRETFQ